MSWTSISPASHSLRHFGLHRVDSGALRISEKNRTRRKEWPWNSHSKGVSPVPRGHFRSNKFPMFCGSRQATGWRLLPIYLPFFLQICILLKIYHLYMFCIFNQVGINLRQISTSSLPGQALPMFRGLMEGSNTEMADVVVVPWVGWDVWKLGNGPN